MGKLFNYHSEAHTLMHSLFFVVVFVVAQLIKPNQRCQQIKQPHSDMSLFFSLTCWGSVCHLAQMGHISAFLTKLTLSPCVNGNPVTADRPTKIHTGDQRERERAWVLCGCVCVYLRDSVCVWQRESHLHLLVTSFWPCNRKEMWLITDHYQSVCLWEMDHCVHTNSILMYFVRFYQYQNSQSMYD